LGWIEGLKDELDLDSPVITRTYARNKFKIPYDDLDGLPFKPYRGCYFYHLPHIVALARDDKSDTRRKIYLDLLELELELTRSLIPTIAGRIRRDDVMALAAELIVAIIGGASHLI
jgi:hypothetical protein